MSLREGIVHCLQHAIEGCRLDIVNLSGTYPVWQSCGMDTPPATTIDKHPWFPVEIIRHTVWRYLWFCFSFREVEELLVGVAWRCRMKRCAKGGASSARSLRSSSGAAGRGLGT